MSLYKRKDSQVYWVKLSIGGQVIQRSSGTAVKQKAQEFHDKLKAEFWEQKKLGAKPVRSWKETVVRFLQETSDKRTHEGDKLKLVWLDAYLGHLTLNDITVSVLDEIRQAKLKGNCKSTANRYMSFVRSVLNRAVNWEWLDKAPKVTMFKEPQGRTRFLTIEEVHRLLKELPEHLQDMVMFTLSCGLRYSNVLKLEWSQVDLKASHVWVAASNSKNGKALSIPLNAQAIAVLTKQIGKHPQLVFTKGGKRIARANGRVWRNALMRAGIKDFRWHDLRHTWASWAVQNGVTVFEIQHLGGWSSSRMVERYAHLSSSHLMAAAKKLDGISYVPATLDATQEVGILA
jgi:integrase